MANLTNKQQWDDNWKDNKKPLPSFLESIRQILIKQNHWNKKWGYPPMNMTLSTKILIETIIKYLPENYHDTSKEIIELGGAGGQILALLCRIFHCQGTALDYSENGLEKAKEYCESNGIVIRTICGDIFTTPVNKKYDIVCSFGLIEHFDDPTEIVAKHYEYLKDGGYLILQVPNFYGGVNNRLMKWLVPHVQDNHNISTMNINNWDYEQRFHLEKIFCDYLGGFNPFIVHSIDNRHYID